MLRIVSCIFADLLIATGPAKHDLIIKIDRRVLNRVEAQANILTRRAQPEQIHIFPTALAGQMGRAVEHVELNVGDARLVGKLNDLRGQLVGLTEGDAHGKFGAHWSFVLCHWSLGDFGDWGIVPRCGSRGKTLTKTYCGKPTMKHRAHRGVSVTPL